MTGKTLFLFVWEQMSPQMWVLSGKRCSLNVSVFCFFLFPFTRVLPQQTTAWVIWFSSWLWFWSGFGCTLREKQQAGGCFRALCEPRTWLLLTSSKWVSKIKNNVAFKKLTRTIFLYQTHLCVLLLFIFLCFLKNYYRNYLGSCFKECCSGKQPPQTQI